MVSGVIFVVNNQIVIQSLGRFCFRPFIVSCVGICGCGRGIADFSDGGSGLGGRMRGFMGDNYCRLSCWHFSFGLITIIIIIIIIISLVVS